MATKSDVSMSTCIDSYGSAIGMPQLCTDWASNQIFWLVVTLVAIFFVLSRLALPRISAVLSERQGTITNDLAAARSFVIVPCLSDRTCLLYTSDAADE